MLCSVGVTYAHATVASNAGELGQIGKAGARLPGQATTLGLMASRCGQPQQRLTTDRPKLPENAFRESEGPEWLANRLCRRKVVCAV